MWKAPLLAAAAIVITATTAGGANQGPARVSAPAAVELQQTLGKGDRLDVVLSGEGSSATETRLKTRVGVLVRYEEGQVVSLDYARRVYTVETIDEVAAGLRRERGLVKKMQIEVPARDGGHNPDLKSPTLRPLELRAEIAGQPARAYALQQQGVKTPVRMWLADDLPAPPEALQERLAGALALPLTAGHAILRTETQVGKGWVTGLDTESVKEVEVTAETFAPPRGWRQVKTRKPASVPARPLRLLGPVSTNTDVFALYWNGPYAAAFTGAMNGLLRSMVGAIGAPSTYWAPLTQYGIFSGRFIGSSPITYSMPANVGTWNFFAVMGMITTAFFTTPVPKIWWRVFARDPVIAVMAPSAALAAGGWSGYHLATLSAGALLPWPVSLSAHPVIPWFITKTGSPAAAPTTPTTVTTSHELVETATDPLPLSANVDYAKSPPWVGGELVDICSVGTPAPPSSTIVKFGFTLGRYWSNAAGACVG